MGRNVFIARGFRGYTKLHCQGVQGLHLASLPVGSGATLSCITRGFRGYTKLHCQRVQGLH